MLLGFKKTGVNVEQTVSETNPLPVEIGGIDSLNNALPVAGIGNNVELYNNVATWGNNALINTPVNVDIALPESLQADALYLLTIINPSANTAINGSVCNKVTIGATAHYPELASFQVLASAKRCILVQGWFLLEAARLVLTNATALGAATGFSANVIVTKV